jgi:hypothetical protein
MMNQMIEELANFCKTHDLEPMSADELLCEYADVLDEDAKAFLYNFIEVWDENF